MPVYLSTDLNGSGPINQACIIRTAEILLTLSGRQDCELSILLISDSGMAELNRKYRGKNGPTNVLSFAMLDGEAPPPARKLLGDIVVSVDTAGKEARREGITTHRRIIVLLIHGLLHLLGFDHEKSDAEARVMLDRERELLQKLKLEENRTMIKLAVNVDHVATLRQARGIDEPDPVQAAGICELAGASGIVVHLREDRRHIQERDVRLLRQTIKTKLNLEMAAVPEIIDIALDIKPDMITLVPEKRQELTTEGGLNVAGQKQKIKRVIAAMTKASIPVSLFVDPDSRQIQAAAEAGAAFVEIHTGRYCDAATAEEREKEFELVARAAEEAFESGLKVNAGHGLNYRTTGRVAALETIGELSIGHAIMARAILVGLDQAVREMLALLPHG